MEDSVVLITGATDGLGKHLARDLAEEGATLLLHGRNRSKGQSVVSEISDATGNDRITYYNADFSSLDEVRRLADQVLADQVQLDVLVNNAGIGFGEPGSGRNMSDDGYELRFQVNYLAGFLLTIRLLELLEKSTPARVVNVASIAQQAVDFDNVMLEYGYSGQRAYAQSKLSQIMFTIELTNRLNKSKITVNALHPATYMDTNMVREADLEPANTVAKGAKAVEYLIAFPEGVSGRFFNGKQQSRAESQAYDEVARNRLWQLSENLVGIETRIGTG